MKTLTLTAVSALALATALPAQAQDTTLFETITPYIGAELTHARVSYDSDQGLDYDEVYEDSFNGAGLYVGARLHENFGIELGYNRTREEDRTVNISGTGYSLNGDTKVQLSTISFDAMGYLPIEDADFELIGSVGLAHTKADAEVTGTATIGSLSGTGTISDDETETKLRLGVGAQYEIADNLNLRGMLRWQDADFGGAATSATSVAFGVNYSF